MQEDDSCSSHRKIYITRRDALTRRIENEKEFVEWLSQYEFELVQLEGLPVVDQAKLFANLRIVLGPTRNRTNEYHFLQKRKHGD